MTLARQKRVVVRAVDLEQPYVRVTSCGEELLVGRYLKAVYLRVWEPEGSGANARGSLPEPYLVVVAGGRQEVGKNSRIYLVSREYCE